MKRFALLLLTIVSLALTSLAQEDTVIEEIIARVNNSIITRADMRNARQQLEQELKQNPNAPADALATREKDLLRDLIDQQLLIQKGQDIGITGEADLIKRLDEIRKQMGAETLDDLEKLATQQGVAYEDFKQNLKNNLVTQKVIGQEVGSHIQITPQEVRAYYDSHKAEMDQPERVRLGEILVSVEPKPAAAGEQQPTEPDAATVAEAEAKANELLKQIKNGTPFEEVAKKSSKGPTAAQGGDLGYFKRGMLAKELEDKTFGMKAGEVSDVIRTKQGYVILKVTDHVAAGVPPFERVQPNIQDAIYMEKLQPALRDYLLKLREEAYIDIKPGYVDTGASPNQTKPIVASANAPANQEVEKKKKKRFLIF